MDTSSNWDDDECSVIGDEGRIGFIDFKDDSSLCDYSPYEQGPVIISIPFPLVDGKPQSVFIGETAAESITIKNTTSEPIELWAVRIYASNPEGSFTISLMKPPSSDSDVESLRGFLESFCMEDRVLQPGKTLIIWLSCKPKEIGLHTTVVHFVTGEETIERVVFLLADDKISQSLASNKPYSRGMRKKHFTVDEFVPGKRPERRTNRVSKKYRLPPYPIPKELREAVESKQMPDAIIEGLTRKNYASYFRALLVMEEMQLEEDMRNYHMEYVNMKKVGNRLVSLEVPGLAERRPSLVHGDSVFVKPSNEASSDSCHPYQGFIHRVEADQVFLNFADEFHFHHRNGTLYNVQFTYNRLNMRRLYQAVEAAETLETRLLFPSASYGKRQIKTTPLIPISCVLNEEQMCSIEMILGCKGAPPYVIHGPPGTGKTMTLVEAILQLYKTRKSARILVCAPSNSSADHILEKILNENGIRVKDNELFRLNAASRAYEDVNPDHIRFCYFEDFVFKCPPLQALMHYRIIISTYMSASLVYSEGIEQGHFSHIFVDEAGQASEPETMIPISHLCRRETVVVLAGDPMQLGAVVYSKDAESYGLGRSYLERLFECELYSDGDENYVTKLVRNYRCHPEILFLPSKLFYNGELIACKDDTSSSTPWVNLLTNGDFPVRFIGIKGCDEREGSNPSWFNRIEASKVVEIVKKLMGSGSLGEEGIGVITPYRQQVLKIKKALESLDMADIKVGSVEQFQGQEKEVIIISTVRSTIKHNEFDKTHCLGFLTNPRRFNVAVTRARSLLIIIGNPHIVSEDINWNKLLWHCSDNNSYQGCGLPERKGYIDEDLQEKDHVDNNSTQDSYLNYNEGNSRPSEDTEWDQGSSQDFPKPVTDEAEWSDGWRD